MGMKMYLISLLAVLVIMVAHVHADVYWAEYEVQHSRGHTQGYIDAKTKDKTTCAKLLAEYHRPDPSSIRTEDGYRNGHALGLAEACMFIHTLDPTSEFGRVYGYGKGADGPGFQYGRPKSLDFLFE